MASIRVPPNCGGMTLATSGAVVAVNRIISGITETEASNLTGNKAFPGSIPVQKTAANGDVTLLLNPTITNITINGNAYAVASGVAGPVPAADATEFINAMKNRAGRLELVQG